MTVLNEPPTMDIDPYSDEVLRDPYAFHEALREAGPVVLIKPYGVYAVGRYEQTKTVFSDHARFSTTGGIGLGDARKPGANFRPLSPMQEVDPPKHTPLRAVANRVLSPVVVRKWRSDMERDAAALVDRLLDLRDVDGVEDIAQAFVFKVFPEAMGIVFDREALLAITEMTFNQTGPQNELYHRAMERAQPHLAWFENSHQRHSALPGGIAEQFFQAEEAGELPAGVASGLVRSFVRGGTDSTISGIGSTLMYLARDAAQWAYLGANPAKVKAAFDEGLRLETPFQIVYRVTLEDTDLDGYQMLDDRKVAMFSGAANRDPRRWERPDAFDASRPTAGHLAFGVGDHNCIGQMTARLESECLMNALLKRVKKIELASEPTQHLMNQLRTLEKLPLRLTPH